MARTDYSIAVSEAESSDTSGAYVDKLSHDFAGSASTDYYVFGVWDMQELTSTVRYVAGKLVNTTASVTYGEYLHEGHDTTEDYYTCFAMGKYTAASTPVTQTFKIQYKGENNAVTAKIRNARIFIVKKDTNDQEDESLIARATTTSASYQDRAAKTWTPGSQGDYVILAVAELDSSSASMDIGVTLDVDGTEYGSGLIRLIDTVTNRYCWAVVKKVNLTAASHTVKIKYKSNGTATVGITNARLIILRADTFDNVSSGDTYYDDDTTRATTTSTTYVDSNASITITPQDVAHVIFASAQLDSSSATQDVYAKLVTNGSDRNALAEENKATTVKAPFFGMYPATLSATSQTFAIQCKAETSNTVGIDDPTVCILQLGADPVSISNKATRVLQAVNRAATY